MRGIPQSQFIVNSRKIFLDLLSIVISPRLIPVREQRDEDVNAFHERYVVRIAITSLRKPFKKVNCKNRV